MSDPARTWHAVVSPAVTLRRRRPGVTHPFGWLTDSPDSGADQCDDGATPVGIWITLAAEGALTCTGSPQRV